MRLSQTASLYHRAVALAAGLLLAASAHADGPKSAAKPRATPLPTGQLDRADWLKFSTAPLAPGEIDRLVAAELEKAGVTPAPRTTDEQFIRRVYLDLTGRLPVPADVTEFLADPAADKRARLIDRLLAGEDYARHWA